MSNEFEKDLEKTRKEIDALKTDEEKFEYALNFVRGFGEGNLYGEVGPGVRWFVENDLSELKAGNIERAFEIIEEVYEGEYAL